LLSASLVLDAVLQPMHARQAKRIKTA